MRTPPANLTKRGLIVAGLVALAGALAWAMWPKPVGVDFAQATRGPLLVTADEEGKTRIKDVYTVSAPIGGKLVRLSLEAGDRVKKDVTTVAVIEPNAPPFLDVRALRELEAQIEASKAAVALAEAEVRQAESELEFAENELTRARALMRSKTISERTMERARIDADTRRAILARAKSNLEVRKRELDSAQARQIGPEEAWKGEVPVGCCVTVRAPVSGRVLRLIQESERVVLPGTPLVEIGDPANLELVVEYLSVDAVKVREGARAAVEGWGGPALIAKVTRVEPAGFTKVSALGIEEQRVRVVLALANPGEAAERLGHEYRVVVKIEIYESAKALRVPISALFRKGDQWAVFTVTGGRARLTPIEIGQRNTTFAEALRGLTEGATVLLHPSDRIDDGTRVVRSNAETPRRK
jgi:HlyD family secretion protein